MAASNHRMQYTCIAGVVFLFLLSGVLAAHGPDRSVCSSDAITGASYSNPAGITRPSLPQQFTLRVECNILDSSVTVDIREFYDGVGNRGAIRQWFEGEYVSTIYKFNEDRVYIVNYLDGSQPPMCEVQNLSTSGIKFYFGRLTYKNGTKSTYSPATVLRFSLNGTQAYRGKQTIRGITTQVWESCVYWDFMDATMDVTWYFTDSSWQSPTLVQEPVRCNVTGVIWVNSTYSRRIQHIYEFSDFRPQVMGDMTETFQTPRGIFCQDPLNAKPLPNVTDYFSFSAEIIRPVANNIDWIKEYYDSPSKLVRYDTRPQQGSNSQYGYNQIIRVHDFNTGVAYIMDAELGNCSVTPIAQADIDSMTTDGYHVRIRTKQEFFDFQYPYTYVGVRSARGIDCDVWVTQRMDWPLPNSGTPTLWEWYFATPEWMESVGYQFEFGLPVMIEVSSASTGLDIIYNIYDYSEDEPSLWTFDISKCYNYSQQRDISFKLPGSFQNVVQDNEAIFRYFVMLSIAGYSTVSPLRVSNIRFDYDSSDDIIVTCTLLDVAPPGVGDVAMKVTETSLDLAAQLLTTAINQGNFVVEVDQTSFANLQLLTAVPYTMTSNNVVIDENASKRPKPGYSAGSMAGIGVGMILVGLLLGFLILYGVYRMRGGSFSGASPGASSFETPTYENESKPSHSSKA